MISSTIAELWLDPGVVRGSDARREGNCDPKLSSILEVTGTDRFELCLDVVDYFGMKVVKSRFYKQLEAGAAMK